jgi:2-keto-4-pentenoate hydratase/2-oxohepta-3-ene-1,7-dioic acid hydratase in catechol pathway
LLSENDLLVTTRLNGETMQSESSAGLQHNVDELVSYISRYITLYPGDLIFTGTPGSTQAMQPGDVVKVEVEGVGVLQNTVSEWMP